MSNNTQQTHLKTSILKREVESYMWNFALDARLLSLNLTNIINNVVKSYNA